MSCLFLHSTRAWILHRKFTPELPKTSSLLVYPCDNFSNKMIVGKKVHTPLITSLLWFLNFPSFQSSYIYVRRLSCQILTANFSIPGILLVELFLHRNKLLEHWQKLLESLWLAVLLSSVNDSPWQPNSCAVHFEAGSHDSDVSHYPELYFHFLCTQLKLQFHLRLR